MLPSCLFSNHSFAVTVDDPGGGLDVIDRTTGKNLMKNGKAEVVDVYEEQPNPTKPPVKKVSIKITKLEADFSRSTYTVTSDLETVQKDFTGFMATAAPGVEVDDRHGRAWAAVLARGLIGYDHLVPTVNSPSYITPEGRWEFKGRMICDGKVEVVRIDKDESSGRTTYTLRGPRPEGEGHNYTTTDWEGLNSGGYAYALRVNVVSPVLLSMALRARYESLGQSDKDALINEQYTQEKRESDARLAKRFRR